MVAHHEICASKMSETWCSDLAAVRAVCAVAEIEKPSVSSIFRHCGNRYLRNKVYTHLALRGFDSGVSLPWRDGVAFAE